MKIFVAAAADQVVPHWRVLGHGPIAGIIATAAELPGGAQWKFTNSRTRKLTALTAASVHCWRRSPASSTR